MAEITAQKVMETDVAKQVTAMSKMLSEKGFFGSKYLDRDDFAQWAIREVVQILFQDDPLFPGEGPVHPTSTIHLQSGPLGNMGKISVGITLLIDHHDQSVDFSNIRTTYNHSHVKRYYKKADGTWEHEPLHMDDFEKEGLRRSGKRPKR